MWKRGLKEGKDPFRTYLCRYFDLIRITLRKTNESSRFSVVTIFLSSFFDKGKIPRLKNNPNESETRILFAVLLVRKVDSNGRTFKFAAAFFDSGN